MRRLKGERLNPYGEWDDAVWELCEDADDSADGCVYKCRCIVPGINDVECEYFNFELTADMFEVTTKTGRLAP